MSVSHQQNPLLSKLIALDLNTNDDDDQTTTAPLVELFLCLIQEEKKNNNNHHDDSLLLYLHIGLLLLWRSLLTAHHARGRKYFDSFPFEVSLFELVSPVNTIDQKRKVLIEELINNLLNSLFHSSSDGYNNNVMINLSSSDEKTKGIEKLLAFIHEKFNNLQKMNIAINPAVVSRFRTEMCLFVLTSPSSFVSPVEIDELILEDDVLKTTLLSTTNQNANSNQEQEDAEHIKKLHFYKNLIIAGVTHAVRLGLLNDDDDTKLLCDMLLQLQSSSSIHDNNICHHRSWLLEVFEDKKSAYNSDGTFLQDFIIDGVLKKQVADNKIEAVRCAAVSPLLPLVSLFVVNLKNDNDNSDSSVFDILLRFAQNNRKNNKRIDGEIALCLLHLSFVTNSAENESASTSFMIEILSLLLDHDGLNFDSSFWSRAFLIAVRSLSIDDDHDSSVIMMLMKELYRQREHYLPPSSSSLTTSRYAIECMFETINDAIDLVQSLDNDDDDDDESSDSERDDEDSIQGKHKTRLSINIRDLVTTIIFASSSSPTLAQRTLIFGTFLRHAILQKEEGEGESAHYHDHRRTKSFFFDLVKLFCSHIMMFATLSEEQEQADENTVASSVSSMSNGLCAVLLLEGYGEPMYEKESDDDNDASRIFDYSFCRTLSKYLKKYLPEFVSLSDGIELLLLDEEHSKSDQEATSFVNDLKEIIAQFEAEEKDGEDSDDADDCYNILENDVIITNKSRVSSSIRSLLKLEDVEETKCDHYISSNDYFVFTKRPDSSKSPWKKTPSSLQSSISARKKSTSKSCPSRFSERMKHRLGGFLGRCWTGQVSGFRCAMGGSSCQ